MQKSVYLITIIFLGKTEYADVGKLHIIDFEFRYMFQAKSASVLPFQIKQKHKKQHKSIT